MAGHGQRAADQHQSWSVLNSTKAGLIPVLAGHHRQDDPATVPEPLADVADEKGLRCLTRLRTVQVPGCQSYFVCFIDVNEQQRFASHQIARHDWHGSIQHPT
jgi:hypothetical protein